MAHNFGAFQPPVSGNTGYSQPKQPQSLVAQASFVSYGAASAQEQSNIRQRHLEYYLEDGNVVLLVENILYRLHRSILKKHSRIMSDLWSMPPPGGGQPKGTSDYNAIYLENVKAIDFTRLLWIIYPPVLGSCKATTAEEWASILGQAERWHMNSLRVLAVKQLRALPMDPVPKIVLWTHYDLDRHDLIPSYMSLLMRPVALSIGEAKKLGIEITARIAQARDAIHYKGLYDSHGPSHWMQSDYTESEEIENIAARMAEDILYSSSVS